MSAKNTTKNLEDAVAFIDGILLDALESGASDIYWIPCGNSCYIRYRINGVQKGMREISGREFIDQCASRIKVLAGMLTYCSSTPQDGAIRGAAKLADAELRVASIPTIHGERICIRIMTGSDGGRRLESLGFQKNVLAGLKQMLEPSSGLIILTGPTGCGKTTTIYSMIRELLRNSQDPASIISIEDPVESVIPGISQISLTRSVGNMDYEAALRAALRQDVKTLVIGEIRDCNVAKVVLNAALSGHRVITTLHAGDIPSVYARLLHQGFEAFLVASAITGILTQRLFTASDGNSRIPAAAFLTPDDEWREFVIGAPGLAGLREKIKNEPHADIKAVAFRMAEKGIIAMKDAMLI